MHRQGLSLIPPFLPQETHFVQFFSGALKISNILLEIMRTEHLVLHMEQKFIPFHNYEFSTYQSLFLINMSTFSCWLKKF